MSTGRLLAEAFVTPATGLSAVIARRSIVAPIVAATVVSLAFAAVLVARADLDRPMVEALERKPDAAQMSQHDRETALAQARKVRVVATYASALLEPLVRAVAAACLVWAAFRLALAGPTFAGTLCVMSWAALPLALRLLLTLPALWHAEGIAPERAALLLPSSLAALLPDTAPVQLRGLAGAVDLFSGWAVVLAALGMAQVARVSRRRSATIVVLVWLAVVLLVDVALPGFARTA